MEYVLDPTLHQTLGTLPAFFYRLTTYLDKRPGVHIVCFCEVDSLLFLAGAAEACGGSTGDEQLHDPPLIFDLEADEAEERPLDAGMPEYKEVADRIARGREELLWDIATDQSVSTADYSTDSSAAPCCDPKWPVCRCHTIG